MSESIALRNRVEHSHERIDAVEKRLNGGVGPGYQPEFERRLDELERRVNEVIAFADALASASLKLDRLEGEIKAMKMRMGKKETA